MAEPVEFEQLDAKIVGPEKIVFQLSNGAVLKLTVNITRIGLALNAKNPDGSDMYNLTFNITPEFIFPDKRFKIPRDQLPPTVPPSNPKGKTYG